MSRDIWFISDTHFQHQNILKWGRSQFSTVEKMDEHMVEKWNSVVKDGDIVYHLGDVFFGNRDSYLDIHRRLKGRKRLVIGNHDFDNVNKFKFMLDNKMFQKVMHWRVWDDKGLVFTHIPIHPDAIVERGGENAINVHGHTHLNGSPEGPYRSVCVELTDYTPVNLEELS